MADVGQLDGAPAEAAGTWPGPVPLTAWGMPMMLASVARPASTPPVLAWVATEAALLGSEVPALRACALARAAANAALPGDKGGSANTLPAMTAA